MTRKAQFLKTFAWVVFLFAVSLVLYRAWIPEILALENPLWDESDRARDAMDFAYALRTFDLLWILNQTVFFQTWGPLFAVFTQIPILVFGPEARALSFTTFCSFVGTGALFFLTLRKHLGFAVALAIGAFTYFWLAGFQGFGSYWIIFMLEGWVILAWTGIALGGVSGSLPLLALSLWLLFLTKFQYFPILFVAVAVYLILHRTKALIPFFKSLIKGRVAGLLSFLIVGLLLHVAIMKVFGPIYGKSTWNGYRAIRNPLVVSWEAFCLLLFLKRAAVYEFLIREEWEVKLTRWFFWPAFLFMAFPWPNRWGAVALTSNAGPKVPFTDIVQIYSSAILKAWVWPQVLSCILLVLLVSGCFAVVVWVWREKNLPILKRLATPHFLVSLIFVFALAVQLVGVNNTQARFAWVMTAASVIGLFALALNQVRGRARAIVAYGVTLVVVGIFGFTNYFSPKLYFLESLEENVGKPFKENPQLFPLDESLAPLLQRAAAGSKVLSFGILQKTVDYYWDLPLRYWLVQNKIKTGLDARFTIFTPDQSYCEDAKEKEIKLILKSEAGDWREVPCATD